MRFLNPPAALSCGLGTKTRNQYSPVFCTFGQMLRLTRQRPKWVQLRSGLNRWVGPARNCCSNVAGFIGLASHWERSSNCRWKLQLFAHMRGFFFSFFSTVTKQWGCKLFVKGKGLLKRRAHQRANISWGCWWDEYFYHRVLSQIWIYQWFIK